MNQPKYSRGNNPASHSNQKRVDRLRVNIPIACSKAQKQAVDEALKNIQRGQRSKYILKLIERAIAEGNTHTVPAEAYECDWQISVSPDLREQIYQWCATNLPPKSRNRWILSLITNYH